MNFPLSRQTAEEIRALARLAIPVALAGAGMSMMIVVSSALVGRSGTVPLAALGLSNLVFTTLSVLAVGIMMGLDPLVSQAFGAGEARRARSLLWQGAWLALVCGAAITVPLAAAPLALESMGIAPEVAETTRWCIWVRIPCLPFMLVFYAQRSYLMAIGCTRPLLVATIVSNLANLLVGFLLVFGGQSLPVWCGPLRQIPPLGAPGACLGMTVSLALTAAILAFAIRRRPIDGPPPMRGISWVEMRAAARVGLPVGLHMAAELGVFTLIGLLAGRLGTVPLAANQIALTYSSLSFTLVLGIGNAGSVRVGLAVGARDTRQARRTGLIALGFGAALMSAWALAFAVFPVTLARLMTDQPEVIAATAPLLLIVALFQVFDGVQGVGAGVLRGAADTRFTFVANLLGHYGIGIPVAAALGLSAGWGIYGLWWGLSAGLMLVATGILLRFLHVSSREILPLPGREPALMQESDSRA